MQVSDVSNISLLETMTPPSWGESLPKTLSQHVDWLRQRGLSETTIHNRLLILAALRRDLGTDLMRATPQQLGEWRAALVLGPEATVNYVWHVRDFYEWAVETGKLRRNPAAKLPVPRLSRRLPRPIAEDPLMFAVQCADYPIRQMLILAGWAGLRAKEIALLRRNNVLERRRPPMLLVANDATKGRHERTVPMSAFVLDELLPVLPASGYVFRRKDGRPGPNTPQRISQMCSVYLTSIGCPDTLHQLRHRFGTATYQATNDLRLVQELMGHASPVSTAGYAAYSQSSAVAAVDKLPAPPRLRSVKHA